LVETLTESFCERCGTRYEFKAPTRLNPLRKTRGFVGGLKNYLTSQDDLSDAMGDAMRSEEEGLASAQLEAFHESFNFCINCRQYTCLNCWNDDAGRCRSCAPIAGTDDLADRIAAAVAGNGAVAHVEPAMDDAAMAEADLQRRLGLDAWPSSDAVAGAPGNGYAPEEWPASDDLAGIGAVAEEPEPMVAEVAFEPEPEPMVAEVEFEPEPEPVVAEVEFEPEPEPVVAEVEFEPEPEPVLAEVEPESEPRQLRVVAWDEDAAYEVSPPALIAEADAEAVLEEVEPTFDPFAAAALAAAAAEPEPEPIVAEVEPEPMVAGVEPEPEPEPVVAEVEPEPEPEPEPVVAEVEPEPEPVVAEVEPQPEAPVAPRIAPISETILRFPTQPTPEPPVEAPLAAQDDSPEIAARRAQLDSLGLGDPGQGPVGSEHANVLPYRSRGATPTPGELAALRAGGGFWEASAREVAGAGANVGVQNCGQCGLSLSASARFCRRCGTRQAQPA
jgi:hypothetical protein